MTINLRGKTIRMGDMYSNISGSTIVNRSLVKESFNHVSHQFDLKTADAIRKLAEVMNASGSRTAAELFDEFNREIVKREPRKAILRSLWEGLKRELPAAKDLAEIAAKIAAIVA